MPNWKGRPLHTTIHIGVSRDFEPKVPRNAKVAPLTPARPARVFITPPCNHPSIVLSTSNELLWENDSTFQRDRFDSEISANQASNRRSKAVNCLRPRAVRGAPCSPYFSRWTSPRSSQHKVAFRYVAFTAGRTSRPRGPATWNRTTN